MSCRTAREPPDRHRPLRPVFPVATAHLYRYGQQKKKKQKARTTGGIASATNHRRPRPAPKNHALSSVSRVSVSVSAQISTGSEDPRFSARRQLPKHASRRSKLAGMLLPVPRRVHAIVQLFAWDACVPRVVDRRTLVMSRIAQQRARGIYI